MLKLAFLNEFKNTLVRCSNAVCIGTGQHFEEIRKIFPVIDEKITALADNSPEKQKTICQLSENKAVTICSVEELSGQINEKTVVLVACADHTPVLKQLSDFPWFDNTDVYCTKHLLVLYENENAEKKKIPEDLKIQNEQCIPKVIHYFWFGNNPIPDKYREWLNSWKKYCPDYEIKEWNEHNYDITKNKYMYQAYQAKKWGFVPDYARLDVIYNYGGIYLDTDVELIKNLDHLLYQKAFAGFESRKKVNLGSGFGAVKGHALIKEMMDCYNELKFIDENGNMDLTASPVYQTYVLLKHGLVQNGEYQIVSDFTVFPEKMFCGIKPSLKISRPMDYTCSIHHYEASWLDNNKKNKKNQFIAEMDSLFGRTASEDNA